MGSKTVPPCEESSPPCEENIVWFVHSNPLAIGTTALRMINDSLFKPGKSA